MSEDKKAPEGGPHTNKVNEDKVHSGKAEGAAASGVSKVAEHGGHDRGPGRARARNQDALPGILGKQLRAAYSELLNAPVPEAITQLIKELENKEPTVSPQKPGKPRREESGQ